MALPFVVVMLVLCWALLRERRDDPGAGPARHHALHGPGDAVRALVGEAIIEQGGSRHHRLRRAAKARTDTDPPEDGPRS